jgi:aryl-alcohol dehydrogenase-like predicted oxidoreductase
LEQRRFGAGGPPVSEIGLGTWQLGGADWGDVGEDESQAVLRAAADAGIDFLDTADVYGLGLSEERIGRFLKATGRRPFVATKLGRFPEPGWPGNFGLEAMRGHLEASRRRLGVEALDLAQLHCIPGEVLLDGRVFDHLRQLQAEGLVRRFGASVESMDEALGCLDQPGLASLQIIFNVFRQKPAEVLFERARERGVALIVRLPLASGLLSGRLSASTRFPESDHRHYNRDGERFNVGETFAGIPFERGVELAAPLARSHPGEMSMTRMALRYCLDFEAVSVVIPGARRVQQVLENSGVSGQPPLPEALHSRLREFYAEEVAAHIRGPY